MIRDDFDDIDEFDDWDEEQAEIVCEDEYYEAESFEEDRTFEEYDDGIEYYDDLDDYEDDLYYDDGYYDDYHKEKGGILGYIRNLAAIDKAIAIVGVAMAAVAVGISTFLVSGVLEAKPVTMPEAGGVIAGIEVIGGDGLNALLNAKLSSAEEVEEYIEETTQIVAYEENDFSKSVTVKIDTTTVYKDLKIKFTNKETGKLVANVPFSVSITDPDNKNATWTDDDKDGIIYKKNITPGTYKIKVNALSGEAYSRYTLPDGEISAEASKELAYKEVDVKNEIKKESQINAAAEDTAKNETAEESRLSDTVEGVESSSGTETYIEVSKSNIPEPGKSAKAGSFKLLTSVSGGDASVTPAPSATATPAATAIPTTSPTAAAADISLDKTTLSVAIDSTAVITATLDKGTAENAAVTAVSSDAGKAAVTVSGRTITVKGVAAGSATITVTHPADKTKTAVCTVTVVTSAQNDKTTKLKDSSGRQLYVKDNGSYREAVYADYWTADAFYVKGETKYTGWQNIDGSTYYFDASGEKVTGEQIIQGTRYNFSSDGALIQGSGTLGIDVSKWNGSIDWNAVKNSGVSYVIIRCGYRGSSAGALIEDPKFASNIKGATAAGLKVGIYFFTQAVDEVEAVEEASMTLSLIRGYRISYPVFLDVESSKGRGDKISRDVRTAVCAAYCRTIANSGYTAGIYANKTWLTEKINTGALGSYKIWLAQYATTPTYTGRYELWQYQSKGRVNGISGNVDMNYSYLGY